MYLNIIRQTKLYLLLIPENISIKGELINLVHLSVNFYDKSR